MPEFKIENTSVLTLVNDRSLCDFQWQYKFRHNIDQNLTVQQDLKFPFGINTILPETIFNHDIQCKLAN